MVLHVAGAGGRPWNPAEPLTEGAVGLTLLRSKFKPGRKLSAYYRRGPGDGTAAEYLAVSCASGAADGDTGAVTVQVFPDDPAMPQLARLSTRTTSRHWPPTSIPDCGRPRSRSATGRSG